MSKTESVRQAGEAISLRKLTHEQARAEQRHHWASKTPLERLLAMWALNRQMAAWRGTELDQPATSWTAQRVAYGRR